MRTKKFIYMIIVLLSVVVLVAAMAFYSLMPKLKVATNNISVEVNSEYSPVAYQAFKWGKDVSNQVSIDGIVDTSKIGNYPVTYSLKEGAMTVRKVVNVTVSDTTEPVITLTGENNMNVCSVTDFIEPGYSAIDNYDGDLTSAVTVSTANNIVTYSVTDSSGNTATVTRNLNVNDSEKPNITLAGFSTLYVPLNGSYKDPGATATDNCSTDLSDKITTSGDVDTSKVGTYTITYSVSDEANNTNSTTREVVVYDSQSNTNNANNNGVIYLTFDDGPGSYTNQILDTLAKYNIKATFFVTCSGSDNTILREYQEGHTVGIHTCSHQWSIYSSSDSFFSDLNMVANRVKTITGQDPQLMRFAGGSSNTVSKHYNQGIMTQLTGEVEAHGYHYFDWNVCIEDAGACAKKGVGDRSACVISYYKKYLSLNHANYVLMHDIKSYTANSLDTMIQYALAQGYTFKALTFDTPTYHQHVNN
jgi:peptidoglycan-N-acetylglucosamine deacetylase